MPEHFSKSTVEAKFWCRKCSCPTMHNVHDGRRGACHVCLAKRDAEIAELKAAPAATQERLF